MKKSLITFSFTAILSASSALAFVGDNQNFSFDNTLVDAVNRNNTDIVRAILIQGTDPNQLGKFETSPLHRAAFNGNIEIANILIQNGADVNIRDYGGAAPLHIAARSGNETVTRTLLQKGADVNATDDHGYSPLHRAIVNKQVKVSELLIDAGSNINTVNNEGNTPLIDAVRISSPELVKKLLIKGADRTVHNNSGLDVIVFALKVANYKIDNILGKTTQELMRETTTSSISVSTNNNGNIPEFLRQEANNTFAAETTYMNNVRTEAIKVPTTSVEVEDLRLEQTGQPVIQAEEAIRPFEIYDLQMTGDAETLKPAPRLPKDGALPVSMQNKIANKKAATEQKQLAEMRKAYQQGLENIKPIEIPAGIAEIEKTSDIIKLPESDTPLSKVVYNFNYQHQDIPPATIEPVPEAEVKHEPNSTPKAAPIEMTLSAPALEPVFVPEILLTTEPELVNNDAPKLPASMTNKTKISDIQPAPVTNNIVTAKPETYPVRSLQIISGNIKPSGPDLAYEAEVNMMISSYTDDISIDVTQEYETEVDSLMKQLVEAEGDTDVEIEPVTENNYVVPSYPRSLLLRDESGNKFSQANDSYSDEVNRLLNENVYTASNIAVQKPLPKNPIILQQPIRNIARKNDYDAYRTSLLDDINRFYNSGQDYKTSYDLSELNERRIRNFGMAPEITTSIQPEEIKVEEIKIEESTPEEVSAENLGNILPENTPMQEKESLAVTFSDTGAEVYNAVIGEFASATEAIEYMNKKSAGFKDKIEYKVANSENSNMYSLTINAVASEKEAQALCDRLSESNKTCAINKK